MSFKDYLVNENIHAANPDKPSDPEVNIRGGGGIMLLSQAERNIRKKVADLAQSASQARDSEDWKQVKAKMEHAWMQAAVDTIIAAKQELEGDTE